jgi:hypothetical protein
MRSRFSDISWFWLELAVSAWPHPGAFVSVFCQDEFAAHGLRPVIPEANIAFNRQKGALLSFTVRLIQNLNARLQRFLPAGHLAEEACHTEIDVLKEPIGKQDQYASAFGGVNQFVFHSDGRTTVQRIFLGADPVQRLEASLFLFHLGGSRSASSILKEQTNNLDRTKVFETPRAMVASRTSGSNSRRMATWTPTACCFMKRGFGRNPGFKNHQRRHRRLPPRSRGLFVRNVDHSGAVEFETEGNPPELANCGQKESPGSWRAIEQ